MTPGVRSVGARLPCRRSEDACSSEIDHLAPIPCEQPVPSDSEREAVARWKRERPVPSDSERVAVARRKYFVTV